MSFTFGSQVEPATRNKEPGGLVGLFAERPMKGTDLRPGDYATVPVGREGGKLLAARVEVVRPGAKASLSAPAPANLHATKAAARHAR